MANSRSSRPYLSVVIPCYNESRRLKKTFQAIISHLQSRKYSSEIIIVNDGSSDSTGALALSLAEQNPREIKVINYTSNRGKGFAVNQGLSQATGEKVVFCDADNATPFEQVDRLIEESEEADIVIGSRHLQGSHIHLKQSLPRRFLARLGNLMIQILLLPGFPDTQCGFKLFNSEVIKELVERQTIWRWGFDIELLYIARKQRLRIAQVPVDWFDRGGSKIQSPFVFLSTLGELFKIKWRSLVGFYR